jgi:ubiquinone/menaquinone biosynthesis C-methylase UbiE
MSFTRHFASENTMGSFSDSGLSAVMCDFVGQRRLETGYYRDIAVQLVARAPSEGRILDIGTGPGFMLKELHELNPSLKLYGLDISEKIVQIARFNLSELGIEALVFHGDIQEAPFKDNFFDLVTCSNSLSYWPDPIKGINEIHRILKPDNKAILFELYKEFDFDKIEEAIEHALKDASPVRIKLVKTFHKSVLNWDYLLGLKLYSVKDYENFGKQSKFKENFSVEKISLIGTPLFVRFILTKR